MQIFHLYVVGGSQSHESHALLRRRRECPTMSEKIVLSGVLHGDTLNDTTSKRTCVAYRVNFDQ